MSAPQKINAIVVDDAAQARDLLVLMLGELTPYVSVIGQAENLEQAVELIRTIKPDVVFLDIEMPGRSGLQIAEEISREEIHYDIIFTTAYNQYALQAFRLSAIDYLLKPLKEKELVEAVQRVGERLQHRQADQRLQHLANNLSIRKDNVICLPVNYGYDYIPVNDIEYIEADGAYAHLFLIDGKRKTISKNLKYFEDALQDLRFFIKVHRSCIINIHYMKVFYKANRGTIWLKSGKSVGLSRSCRNVFLERLEALK